MSGLAATLALMGQAFDGGTQQRRVLDRGDLRNQIVECLPGLEVLDCRVERERRLGFAE